MEYQYVVLGGGCASGYAARTFVENGVKPGQLAIITSEPHVAYERPAISKGFLLGQAKLPGFHTCVGTGGEKQTPEWYTEKGITYMTNTTVDKVSPDTHTLHLADGRTVKYEKLIVATGARAVHLTEFGVPGADLGGIHYLRDVADGEALLAAADKVKEAGGRTVIVGGGYIGMEVAAGLASRGVPNVTLLFPEDRLLARLLTPELAAVYERFFKSKGIGFVHKGKVTGFEGQNGKVTSVSYKDDKDEQHSLPADLVVVGIGAKANDQLFSGALETAAGGIKVDGQMQTSLKDVYAVGDVAAFPQKSHATGNVSHTRQEHVTHARLSAAQAAKAALGLNPPPYEYLPYFYSRIFNLGWVFYGEAAGKQQDFGEFEAGKKFGAMWLSDAGQLQGMFLEGGSPDENNLVKEAVGKKVVVDAAGTDLGKGETVLGALKAKL